MKANTEEYIRELKLLAHRIQEEHGQALKALQDPVALIVKLPEKGEAYFLIDSEGIHYKNEPPQVKNIVSIGYKDLLRVIEKPSRIVRYLFEGKVRIEGDYQKIVAVLQKLL